MKQQLEGQINVLKEQINTARINEEHYANRRRTIQQEWDAKKEQKAGFVKDSEAIHGQLERISNQDTDAKEQLIQVQSQIAEETMEIEQSKEEIMRLLNNRASTQAKIQHFDTTQQQITTRRAQIHREILEVSSEAEQYGRELEQQRRGFEEITAEIQAFQDLISVNEQNIAEFQRQLDEKQEKLRIGQTAYHRESSRLESLKNITERYDGYGNSIRRVMSCKNREKGLIGVVADIIKVEKEYEIAVETALGGSIQNIVTDDEETAKRMIAYLKQNKYGRATFLPLTSMQGGAELWQMDALKETGVIGLAHTLVHVEERFLGLAKQLLGRTIVVENIDCGIRIARKYKQSLRLVTLEGELINPGGP